MRPVGEFHEVRPPSTALPGAQVIGRAFQLLRAVASGPAEGMRLADLAVAAGLTVATTHRILQALRQEGALDQDGVTRRYRLGSAYLAMAEATTCAGFQGRLRPAMEKAAEILECSVYLSVPAGTEMLCIDRAVGCNPIRVVPYDVGERRPLGVGAAGIALLAIEPPAVARAALARNTEAYSRYGLKAEDVFRMVEACRRNGFSYNPGHFISGVAGIGIAFRDPATQRVLAVNVALLAARVIKAGERSRIANLLLNHVAHAFAPLNPGG
jgi:DNA-binding IclR family transcriptional regulator